MSISEAARHEMHTKLEEVLGAQVAATMMEHLPPVGWADVATKRDLQAQSVLMKRDLDSQTVLMKRDLEAQSVLMKRDLEAQTVMMKGDLEVQTVLMKRDLEGQTALLDGRFERVELQFRSELRGEINRLMLWQFPTMVTLLGVAFAAAKLS